MSPTETGEINPRGLRPSHIWQMDVTHLLENLLMYMSQLILTLNLSGQLLALENLQDMLFHICVAALLLWASHIKTDNGPAYNSSAFRDFFKAWSMKTSYRNSL